VTTEDQSWREVPQEWDREPRLVSGARVGGFGKGRGSIGWVTTCPPCSQTRRVQQPIAAVPPGDESYTPTKCVLPNVSAGVSLVEAKRKRRSANWHQVEQHVTHSAHRVPFTGQSRPPILSSSSTWGRAVQLASHDSKLSLGRFVFVPSETLSKCSSIICFLLESRVTPTNRI
jgi:hypothetical protein